MENWSSKRSNSIIMTPLGMFPYILYNDTILLRLNEREILAIRESSKAFFIELVSTLCFGQPELPEPELVKHLLNIVFKENSTKDFTYTEKAAADRVPVIRSFLLQLLLEHE